MEKIKLLWVGDFGVSSGFARVTENVLDRLPKEEYDISVFGINYSGEPHEHPYKVWPARYRGDPLGTENLGRFVEKLEPDVLFLFNDLWVVTNYKRSLEKLPSTFKTVTYFPVDSEGFNNEWITNIKGFDKILVYTNFAKAVLRAAGYRGEPYVIPHGFDKSVFFPIKTDEARKLLSGLDSTDFIVFNANRNQARKRIDITIKGFCKFTRKKPETRLYLHMGMIDCGWDILALMRRECMKYGIDMSTRLVITNPDMSPTKSVSLEHLNIIYNTANVGLNTGLGEGWGLCNFEQAACGVPQIVPDFSATKELFENRGILLPIRQKLTSLGINTEGGLVHEDDVAAALETCYTSPDLMKQHADAMYEYLCQPQFTWDSVARKFDEQIKDVL